MTAEQFLKDVKQNPEGWTAKKMLIEFAEYHVKQAIEKVENHLNSMGNRFEVEYEGNLKSIYPLKNIK